ncbi:MAG: hypothetical protein AAF825_01420 [Pseudomonadota bacterium]
MGATDSAGLFRAACLHDDGPATIAAAGAAASELGLPARQTDGPGRWKDSERDISIALYQDDDILECSLVLLQSNVTGDYPAIAAALTEVIDATAEATTPYGDGFTQWAWGAGGKAFSVVFYQRDGRFVFISKVPE